MHALRADNGSVGTTAIDKRPVDGPVRVRTFGLHADVQADRRHHGGEQRIIGAGDRAVVLEVTMPRIPWVYPTSADGAATVVELPGGVLV